MTGAIRTGAPSVTVVIPAFNCADLLERQLAAMSQQSYDGEWEILVGDNGSSDHLDQVVSTWAARGLRVRRVDASARRGPAAARNLGAAASNAQLLAFSDADDQVADGWLTAHVAALEAADVVSGAVDFQLMQGEPVVRHDASPRQFNFLPAGLGANLAVRREAFQSVGGFDEALLVGEDIDLCWRLQLSGHRFAYCPEALVHKSERATLAELRRQWFGYGRGDPTLYRRFRKDGMSRNWWLTVKTYGWLIVNAVRALRPGPARELWVKVWSLRIGRIVGSIDNRVMYL